MRSELPSMDEENDLRRFLIRGTGSQLADNKSLKDMLDDIEGDGWTSASSLVEIMGKTSDVWDAVTDPTSGTDALKALIDAIEVKVDALGSSSLTDIEAKLDHAEHGLAALKTLIDAIEAKLDALDLDPLKTTHNVEKNALAYNSIIAGTWAIYNTYAQCYSFIIYNSSKALNDELQYKFSHKAGEYTFRLLHETYNDGGILTVSIDGVAQGTIDLYSSGVVYNVIRTVPVTITTDGEHTLNLKVTGKNASSLSYCVRPSAWWLTD